MKTSELTNDQKNALRKIKKVSGKVKVAMYNGNTPPPCIQFNRDVWMYNLYEAILYLEGYERDGLVSPGTAERVIEASGV
jgi:ribosomal protein L25 (general stress protein Ctc)